MSWAEAACHIVRGRPLALIDNQRAFLWRAASLNRREGCWPASLTVYSPWQTSAAALNWKQEEEEFKTITSQRERERESFHYERSSLRFVTSCSRFSCVARLQLFRLTESIWRKKTDIKGVSVAKTTTEKSSFFGSLSDSHVQLPFNWNADSVINQLATDEQVFLSSTDSPGDSTYLEPFYPRNKTPRVQ